MTLRSIDDLLGGRVATRASRVGTTRFLRWGHGLGVRIPLSLARRVGVENGTQVDLLHRDGIIVLRPVSVQPTLGDLLAGVPVKLRWNWTPGRGDVVSVRMASDGGRRPALVLSPAAYSARTGSAVCCVLEEEVGPFAVAVPDGLPVRGAIPADGVVRLDVEACGMQLVCPMPHGVVTKVLERVAVLVGEPPGD